MISTFFEVIKQEKLLDIVVCGLVDIEHGIAKFIPMTDDIYFEFETTMIKFESVEQYSKLKIKYVDTLSYKFEDEDMYLANSSISKLVLTNVLATILVKSIEIYGGEQIHNELICEAASFCLNTGQELFIDPGFVDGIGIGGEHQRNVWLKDYSDTEFSTMSKSIIELV